MTMRKTISLLAMSLAAFAGARADTADVVVYGGTPAGITAAITAAREGASVVLLEPGRHLGGVVSGGLGHTDIGNPKCIGGLSREYFERIGKHYGKALEWYFEPHIAERTFVDWIAETQVRVLFGKRLAEAQDAMRKDGGRITEIKLEDGATFAAGVFIDATYEGDLMARAGVSYVTGREGRDAFGEPLAGVQGVPLGDWDEYMRTRPPHGPGHSSLTIPTIAWYKTRPNYLNTHQFPVKVNALDADGRPLPGITPEPLGTPGAGDRKFMAYNFRLCLTKDATNRIAIAAPPGYDAKRYELLARYIAAWPDIELRQLFHIGRMPAGKTDFNTSGPCSTDHLGANWDYPDATYARRQEIWEDHKRFIQGMFFFLATDPRLPEALRREAGAWGLCRDEFADTDHWPRQLYVRVARRMKGVAFMTQQDVQKEVVKVDSVAMGSFIIDSHNVQRVLTTDGCAINEGGIEVPARPYQIPYGVLAPQKTECGNLLVPVCMSASYIAYCTLRMEPVYMALGHAAGVAAATAARSKTAVQDLSVPALQEKLLAQRQVIRLEGSGVGIDPRKLAGMVVDDESAKRAGEWTVSTFGGGGVCGSYRHDGNTEKGARSARFETGVPVDGGYEVRFGYVAYENRATNVTVRVHAVDGVKTVQVNERRKPPHDGHFTSLGVFRFAAAQPVVVEVSNANTEGYVVIDAIQLLPAGP